MEEFKDIPWYEGLYKINLYWDIKYLWNCKRWKYWTILSKVNTDDWYLRTTLWKDGKRKSLLIHRLVALTFIPNPDNKLEVNHIDGNKHNNFYLNLEWCTKSENQKHRYQVLWQKPYWEWKFWKEHNCSISVNQYSKSWEFIKMWDSMWDVERELKIPTWHIWACCKWRKHYNTAGWYKWEYANIT